MGAIIVASLAWSLNETANNPTLAYFSTLSRGWELGLGALLAIASPMLSRISATTKNVMAWAGLAGIIGSIAFVSSEMAFPGPWAIPPVIATALVIVAGTGAVPNGSRILTNPPMVYVGNLSYSLYLWHFPVIIFMEEFIKDWKWFYFPGVFAFTLLLALLSFHYIEEPVRNSSWLLGKNGSKRNRNTGVGQNAKYTIFGSFVVATTCMIATAFVPTTPLGPDAETTSSTVEQNSAQFSETQKSPEVEKLQGEIEKSAEIIDWPDNLSPSIDAADADGTPDERSNGCGEPKHGDDICNYNNGKTKQAIVFSDSTGIALVSTLREAIGDEYNIRGMAMAGCVSIDLTIEDDRKQHMEDCDEYKKQAISIINETKPDLVFISNTSGVLGQIEPEIDGLTGASAWEAATERTAKLLEPSEATVVLTTSPPIGRTPSTCATRTSQHNDCMVTPGSGYQTQLTAIKTSEDSSNAVPLDLTPLYCTASGQCPVFVGDTLMRKDTIHLTEQYSRKIAPAFKELLDETAGL